MLSLARFSRPVRLIIRLLWIAGGLGLAIFEASAIAGHGSSRPDVVQALYTCLYLVPAALCLLRAVLVREERGVWGVFGVGMLSFAAAYGHYFIVLEGLQSPPYPSPSDALWLGYYAAAFVALLMLMRSRLQNFRRSLWIDAVVGGLAIAAVASALLIEPILEATGGSVAAVTTSIAYPLFDVLIISLVLGVFALSGWRPGRTWTVIGAVFALQCVSDTIYLYQAATGTYEGGGLLDATWLGYMLLIAFAAWQQPTVTQGRQIQGRAPLAITGAFAVVGLVLTTYDSWHDITTVAVVLATLTLVAAFVRTAMTFGDMRALAQSQELIAHNELILDAAGEGICGLDRDGVVTFANPMAAQLTGYETTELIGRCLHTMVHHTRADGAAYPFAECPVSASLADATVHHSDRDVYWRKDGSSFPVEFTCTPIVADGEVSGAVIVFKDITQRKQAEQLLERQRRQLVEAQAVGEFGSWEWDIAADATEWSAELFRIYGLEPSDEPMTFEDFLAHVHPDDRASVQAEVQSAYVSGERFSFEHRIVRADGVVRACQARGEVIRAEDGTPVRMLGTGQDITKRREVERAKDEFTAVVSHELRTPLTSIRGSLGLLESGVLGALPAQGQRMVEIAVQNTDRLVRLINDILDIERINSGEIDMHPEPCDARELIERATDAVASVAAAAEVTVLTNVEPVVLSADGDRVIQTLTNLISNAVKFSPAGSSVRVSCARQDGEVLFEVSDEGRGIPEENLESIFGRFAQVDASDSREKGGTGLGLAICRSIVEQHGGRIWAESIPGAGATFSFLLPAPLADDASPRASVNVDGPRVLVCDDDPCVVDVVSTVLEQRGYRVSAVQSGEQALEHAIAQPPDAILLDLLMPGMSGWETAAALKRHAATQDIPIVILSVLAEAETAAPDGPIVGWVQKPLDDAQLFAALERAVNGRDEPLKVLVVEDDADLAGVLVATFDRHGVHTFHAADGAQAIAISQRVLPDLVVLDIGLPEVDGFEVAGWLRRHELLNAVPIVVYTARDLDEADRERLRLGATTQFLTKGRISPVDFEDRVMSLLGGLTRTASPEVSSEPHAYPVAR